MTVVLQNAPPPPLTSAFNAPAQKSGEGFMRGQGANQSGISFQWQQWFQSLLASIQSQLANIAANAITPFTQATLPTLTAADKGFLAVVTDYNHLLEWNGTAWEWGPGENGSGYVEAFLAAPTSVGWHLCDGSTVNQLNANGTISPVTLPNYTTASYLKLATVSAAGPNPPSGATGATSGGTPSGTNASSAVTGTTGVESADQTVQSGSGVSVAAASHTHSEGGSAAGQLFSGAALPTHTHTPGTIDLENTTLLGYFRQ